MTTILYDTNKNEYAISLSDKDIYHIKKNPKIGSNLNEPGLYRVYNDFESININKIPDYCANRFQHKMPYFEPVHVYVSNLVTYFNTIFLIISSKNACKIKGYVL